MLVLTRKTGQKLIIADNIEVMILETKGDSVKIGIVAPKDVAIYREEIYEEIKKANQQSISAVHSADLDQAVHLMDASTTEKAPAKAPDHHSSSPVDTASKES